MIERAPTILFVCTGNAARSVMAAAMLRSLTQAVSVTSAGTHSIPGLPMSTRTRAALADYDIVDNDHRSAQLDDRMVAEASMIAIFEPMHLRYVRKAHPEAAPVVASLPRLARDLADGELASLRERVHAMELAKHEFEEWEEVVDPAGGELPDFQAAAGDIERLVAALGPKIGLERVAPDLSGDIRRRISLDPPRYRGVLHTWCIPVAIVAGIVATLSAPAVVPRILVAVYGLSLVAMLSFSALFHRVRWTDDSWWRMRQLDHTGIYLVIAGSFTGIAGLALDGGARLGLLIAVWLVVIAGIAYRWLPVVPPFGLTTAIFVAIVAMVVPFLGRLGSALGAEGTTLLLVGCVVYFFGALALGARVPDLKPKVFGYHEVWHVVVVISSAMHYVVVVGYAIPAARVAINA